MILLDTCALIWLASDPGSLSAKAAAAIRRYSDGLTVSPISAWEVAIRCRSGGLRLSSSLTPADWYEETVRRYGMHEMPLDARLLCMSVTLPPIHRDPCDRMLIATALTHRLPLVTADATIARYPGVKIVW